MSISETGKHTGAPASPSCLGRYVIQTELGRGRTSVVYEGYDELHDQPVAVKVWSSVPLTQDDLAVRLEACLRNLVEMHHPNILGCHDYGLDPDAESVYLVMPYISGSCLDQRLGEPWPATQAVRVIAELARAIDYAHGQGVVHGSLCPRQVYVTDGGWPLLTDFGLSLFWEGAHDDVDLWSYWAPERLRNSVPQHTDDIYALGVLLYEMLAGRRPFSAGDRETLLGLQMQGVPLLCQRGNSLPPGVAAVVTKALDPDPRLRFGSGADLARALMKALPPEDVVATQSLTPPPQGRLIIEGEPASTPTLNRPHAVDSPNRIRWKRVSVAAWRVTLWLVGKIAAAVLVLMMAAMMLAVVATLALGAFLEQRIATQSWDFAGWESGGHGVIREADLGGPLDRAVEPYALGLMTGLVVDFAPPDSAEVRGTFRDVAVSLSAQVWAVDGVPQILLRRINARPLYVVGGILSNYINRGLQASWEDVPVIVSSLTVYEDRVEVTLKPVE